VKNWNEYWENRMSESNWDHVLATATEEVLETMFFTSTYGAAQAAEPDAAPRIAARLTFEGTPCGAMTLSVTEAAARTLTANFLAAEPDDSVLASQLDAVVCELANMICGAVLSRVESQAHFHLFSPQLLPSESLLPSGPPNQSLDLGDGTLNLWLTLETHAG
jgi:CheY-specific phosphatase CheX